MMNRQEIQIKVGTQKKKNRISAVLLHATIYSFVSLHLIFFKLTTRSQTNPHLSIRDVM